jgi:hypothetical protein
MRDSKRKAVRVDAVQWYSAAKRRDFVLRKNEKPNTSIGAAFWPFLLQTPRQCLSSLSW